MKQSILTPFDKPTFGDIRIDQRAKFVLQNMITAGSAIINQCCRIFTEKIGAYRMLNNDKCTSDLIIKALASFCQEQVQTKHILCLQDTSEINYASHNKRMQKKGRKPGIVSNDDTGCFIHPVLAIDADKCSPIGFPHVKVWNREKATPGKKERKYKTVAIEQKESYRWVDALIKTREVIPKETLITVIGDRESDIYEFLEMADEHTKILIRSNQNRCLIEEDIKLTEKMNDSVIQGTYLINIPPSHARKARVAKMEVRFESVRIKRPANKKPALDFVSLYCIQVKESPETIPAGEKGIEWRLLTNHEIKTVEDALRCVKWYQCRWYIEELFRVLKSKGFGVEEIQLESDAAIQKNLLFSLQAALQIMLLKIAFDKKDEQIPASVCFSNLQIKMLAILQPKLEGKTAILKNSFQHKSLAWAAWIIARLGAWSGYLSQSRPGYITFKAGFERFNTQFELFNILSTDVYKE